MACFRSPKSQAKHAVSQKLAIGKPSHSKQGGDGKVHSLGTKRTYQESLAGVAVFMAKNGGDVKGKGLAGLNVEIAQAYLEHRSGLVRQKQLDKDRQSMQMILTDKLLVEKSVLDPVVKSRAYTATQIQLIAYSQTPKHSLATQIAADAGLRAHELLTIAPLEQRLPSSHRIWTDERFLGRIDVQKFTVVGKGGLIREIAISSALVEQLELLRLAEPLKVVDRTIYYQQQYDIAGGKQWSDSFSKASTRALGWSTGAHGVRHSYAQTRMRTLQSLGMGYASSLAIVSQEMGHFRGDITEVYLR